MPANLTGNSIADIYTSLLHLSSASASSSLEAVFDGLGNSLPVYVSTIGVSLSGNVTVNNMKLPTAVGSANQIMSVNSAGNLEYRTVVDVLTSSSVSSVTDGIYSAPKITMLNGFIQSLADNTSVKTFYLRTTEITNQKILALPQQNWSNPVVNDIAYVFNLGSGIVYKVVYTGTGWNITESI